MLWGNGFLYFIFKKPTKQWLSLELLSSHTEVNFAPKYVVLVRSKQMDELVLPNERIWLTDWLTYNSHRQGETGRWRLVAVSGLSRDWPLLLDRWTVSQSSDCPSLKVTTQFTLNIKGLSCWIYYRIFEYFHIIVFDSTIKKNLFDWITTFENYLIVVLFLCRSFHVNFIA